jgi:hypothetical protein
VVTLFMWTWRTELGDLAAKYRGPRPVGADAKLGR